MTVLVLGAKGMLGQEMVKQLGAAGFEVTAWDKEELDITDAPAVEKKISESRPRIIVNCVAFTDVDKAESEGREAAFKINDEAVGNLARMAANLDALFIHFSTDYVFDGKKDGAYVEADKPNPVNQYGKSKLQGEERILSYKLQVPNFKYYIIRVSRLFGPAGGGKKSFVDKMLEKIGSNEPIEVIDEVRSAPTYVVDAARATIEMINNKVPYGIYHRINAGSVTWYGWAKKIFELVGRKARLVPISVGQFNFKAPRSRQSVLVSTKLPPLRNWQEALKEYLSKNF